MVWEARSTESVLEMTCGIDRQAHLIAQVDLEQGVAAARGWFMSICGRRVFSSSLASPPGARCPRCRAAATTTHLNGTRSLGSLLRALREIARSGRSRQGSGGSGPEGRPPPDDHPDGHRLAASNARNVWITTDEAKLVRAGSVVSPELRSPWCC